MVKRYLFFLRHYNDIDNITPAIYFFLIENEKHRADIILYYDDYDYRSNNNLLFLKNKFKERISYQWLGNFFGLDLDVCLYLHSLKGLNKKEKYLKKTKKVFHDFFNNPGGTLHNYLKNPNKYLKKKNMLNIRNIRTGNEGIQNLINQKMKTILYQHSFPKLVVFDINRTSQIKGIIKGLRSNGVKRIICLPVSPLININTLREQSFVYLNSEHFKKEHDYSGIDAIGYVDNYFVASFNKTHELLGRKSTIQNKTKALGSIRYCPKWIEIREQNIQPFNQSSDKIKAVFFLSRPKSNVNWNEVEQIFAFMTQYPEFDIIIKHHTRYKPGDNSVIKKNLTFINDADSCALINWADVIFFWSTSIAIEGYIKNKTMVCLSYVCGNRNLYELYDAGYVARCRDDLHEFMELYRKDVRSIHYNTLGIKKLLNEAIIPGENKVIKNYLTFMKENEM